MMSRDNDAHISSGDGIGTPVDDATGGKSAAHMQTAVVHWDAPFPPPALLAQYDDVVPGLSAQIAEQVRDSDHHIQELARKALEATIKTNARGQWMGFIVVMAILLISAFAIAAGAYWVAGVALSIVTATGAVFVLGTLKKKDEDQSRD